MTDADYKHKEEKFNYFSLTAYVYSKQQSQPWGMKNKL